MSISELLNEALRKKQHERLVELLTDLDGSGLAAPTPNGTHPLHLAAAMGNLEAVELFLKAGMDVNVSDGARRPLSCAAGGNQAYPVSDAQMDVVRHLVAQSADLAGEPPSTPLMEAVRANAPEMVRLLWELGARPLPNGMEIQECGDRGNSAVCAVVAELVGGDPSWGPEHLTTGLVAAARSGHAKAVTAFLDAGADVNDTEDKGKTALHWNAMWGKCQRLEVCNTLIEHGADLDVLDDDEVCPLVWAVAGGFQDLVTRLLDAGAEPNRTDAFPPLFQAAFNGNEQIVDILIAAGADPALVYDDKTAVDWARQKGHTALVQKLDSMS